MVRCSVFFHKQSFAISIVFLENSVLVKPLTFHSSTNQNKSQEKVLSMNDCHLRGSKRKCLAYGFFHLVFRKQTGRHFLHRQRIKDDQMAYKFLHNSEICESSDCLSLFFQYSKLDLNQKDLLYHRTLLANS